MIELFHETLQLIKKTTTTTTENYSLVLFYQVLEQDIKQRRLKCNSVLPGEDDPVRERDFHLHEKRTRFSLSHDQDSIGIHKYYEFLCSLKKFHYS